MERSLKAGLVGESHPSMCFPQQTRGGKGKGGRFELFWCASAWVNTFATTLCSSGKATDVRGDRIGTTPRLEQHLSCCLYEAFLVIVIVAPLVLVGTPDGSMFISQVNGRSQCWGKRWLLFFREGHFVLFDYVLTKVVHFAGLMECMYSIGIFINQSIHLFICRFKFFS